jgi:hypothetical protein
MRNIANGNEPSVPMPRVVFKHSFVVHPVDGSCCEVTMLEWFVLFKIEQDVRRLWRSVSSPSRKKLS